MAAQCGTNSRGLSQNKIWTKEEQIEWLKQQLRQSKENYAVYKTCMNGKINKTSPQFSTRERSSLNGLNINWKIENSTLCVAFIFRAYDLEKYEILETLRHEGSFKQFLGKEMPQIIQTFDSYIALCYNSSNEIIPYWDKEKLRAQFTQQYTQTAKEKVYSVIKKKEFDRKIDRHLPKTFDVKDLESQSYMAIPTLINISTENDKNRAR